jgi:hypothetical protein
MFDGVIGITSLAYDGMEPDERARRRAYSPKG